MGDTKCFGRYEVRDTIGRGAMGVVYLAEDPLIGRKVAIKVVEAHKGLDDEELDQLRARFEREFQSAGRLSHPNIVGVHDVGQEDGDSFIAMEYVAGESLHSILAEGRAFSFKEIADLTLQLCSGLDYAHEFGIVHRDIKPGNILITREGRPKITDFGVAKVATTNLTRTGTVVGTPAFMSPEQVTGHPVTGAADQFSLAVMIYQMLTGERPFTGENPTTIMYKIVHEKPLPPSALNAMVPGPVDQALIKALAKNPTERYPTCMELAEALRAALGAAPADSTLVVSTAQTAASTAQTDETVVDPSLQRALPPIAAAQKRQGLRVIGLAAAGVAVIGLAIAAWAYSLGAFGGDSTVPAQPEPAAAITPVPVTQSLTIEAGDGWRVWVNGGDSGVVTPGTVELSGTTGDEMLVELRAAGLPTVSSSFTLGGDLLEPWAPEEAAMAAVASGGEDGASAEDPAAEPLMFTIVSNPPGATVTFDGDRLEQPTPVEVAIDPTAEHSVAIDLEGYNRSGLAFTTDNLNAGQLESRRLEFPLTPSIPPGFVQIDDPGYPVVVTVTPAAGGRSSSFPASSTHRISLTPGRYTVELSAPSVFWAGERRDVTVESEQAVALTVPRVVTVQVAAVPGNCTVSIDDVEVGATPFPQMITVGTHKFTWNWEAIGRGTKERQVSVNSNGQRIVEQSGSGQ